MNQLVTDRLIGSPPNADHFDDVALLYRDATVMATLSKDGQPLSDDAVRQRLQGQVDHWDNNSFGYAIFHHRDEGHFVGRGGLSRYELDSDPEIELGYAIVQAHWRQGYATEIARAWLDVGFGPMNLESIIAFTLPTNLGSRRVMDKVGFQYERDFVHAELPHVLYRIHRSAWRNRQ